MQQTFSLQRCSQLFAKHWAENKKRYLLSIAAYISLTLVWFIFVMITDESYPLVDGLQQVTFFFSAIAIGPFFASQFFNELSSKSKATNYLMVPASTFEKLLCSLLYVIVLFPLVLTAAFYFVDALAIVIANTSHDSYNLPNEKGVIVKETVVNVFSTKERNNDDALYYGALVFLALQSAALLGSVYFTQYSYIKTAISLVLIFLFVAWLQHYWMSSIMPRGFFQNSITRFRVFNEQESKLIQLPEWIGKVLEVALFYGTTIILWTVTYFRLKEKEV
jgi:hypothetical protein